MNFTGKLMQMYFNYAYNPVYDFTTARFSRYRNSQKECIGKLDLIDNDKILCVGVGTGNEVLHLLQTNKNVNIVGVDYSNTALKKAYKKALTLGKKIEGFVMDAQNLEFTTGSFDKVLCLHVMDFIEDNRKVTVEILRILKDGGQFVITFPSHREGPRLGVNLFSDDIRHGIDSGKHRIRALLESIAQMLLSIIYLPLLFRPKRKVYSHNELEAIITDLTTGDFHIQEDKVYQDFIVYGRK